uniref:RING-type domain-containing protein n=1 Tax=Parastrongyloides trichosuri TaxID=131310 RepID=A0A0N4ZFA4_PARTI
MLHVEKEEKSVLETAREFIDTISGKQVANADFISTTDRNACCVTLKRQEQGFQRSNNILISTTNEITTKELEKSVLYSFVPQFKDIAFQFENLNVETRKASIEAHNKMMVESEKVKESSKENMIHNRNGATPLLVNNVLESANVLMEHFIRMYEINGYIEIPESRNKYKVVENVLTTIKCYKQIYKEPEFYTKFDTTESVFNKFYKELQTIYKDHGGADDNNSPIQKEGSEVLLNTSTIPSSVDEDVYMSANEDNQIPGPSGLNVNSIMACEQKLIPPAPKTRGRKKGSPKSGDVRNETNSIITKIEDIKKKKATNYFSTELNIKRNFTQTNINIDSTNSKKRKGYGESNMCLRDRKKEDVFVKPKPVCTWHNNTNSVTSRTSDIVVKPAYVPNRGPIVDLTVEEVARNENLKALVIRQFQIMCADSKNFYLRCKQKPLVFELPSEDGVRRRFKYEYDINNAESHEIGRALVENTKRLKRDFSTVVESIVYGGILSKKRNTIRQL